MELVVRTGIADPAAQHDGVGPVEVCARNGHQRAVVLRVVIERYAFGVSDAIAFVPGGGDVLKHLVDVGVEFLTQAQKLGEGRGGLVLHAPLEIVSPVIAESDADAHGFDPAEESLAAKARLHAGDGDTADDRRAFRRTDLHEREGFKERVAVVIIVVADHIAAAFDDILQIDLYGADEREIRIPADRDRGAVQHDDVRRLDLHVAERHAKARQSGLDRRLGDHGLHEGKLRLEDELEGRHLVL